MSLEPFGRDGKLETGLCPHAPALSGRAARGTCVVWTEHRPSLFELCLFSPCGTSSLVPSLTRRICISTRCTSRLTIRYEYPYEIVGRRLGDVPDLTADPALAEKELGFKAKYNLEEMVSPALELQ